MDLKSKIEKALSEILSDKYNCKVVLRFEKQEAHNRTAENNA